MNLRLIRNWSLLVISLGELVVVAFWLIAHRWPVAGTLTYTQNVDWVLPFALHRAIDPLVVLAPIMLLIWAEMNPHQLGKMWPVECKEDRWLQCLAGAIVGMVGALTVTTMGITALLICTPLIVAIMYFGDWKDFSSQYWRPHFVVCLAAVIMWALAVVAQGTLAGCIYFAIAAVIVVVTGILLQILTRIVITVLAWADDNLWSFPGDA